MKKRNSDEITKILPDLPARLSAYINALLDDEDVNKKLRSRAVLVNMGKEILPQIHKLCNSGDVLVRMEAVKIVELIASRVSIAVLIDLLNDTEFDIRWIAAEGLIKIGRRSIRPILKSVRNGNNSVILNRGAHHVLISLLDESEKKNGMSLLLSLENYHTLGIIAPVEASIALKPDV